MDSSCPEYPESCLVRLAEALGRAVGMERLTYDEANEDCVRLAHDGCLDRDPVELARVLQHIMRLNANKIIARRETTTGAIQRVVRPLIAIGARSARLREGAYYQNGAAGYPLTEAEVDEIVAIEIWTAEQAEGEVRYGG